MSEETCDTNKLIVSGDKAEDVHVQDVTELCPLKINLSEPGFQNIIEEDVKTSRGTVHVAIQGDRTKKLAMVTLHDIGMDYISCFQSFFCFHQLQPVLKHYCVYHLSFPGQEEHSAALPDDFAYPTMDEMAAIISEVLEAYQIRYCVCIGVGAGANVFLRLALHYPKLVECLVLINGTCSAATWGEWGYQKVASHYLKKKGMTKFTEDYLLWHYFGKVDEYKNPNILYMIRDHLHGIKHTKNLSMLIDSYIARKSIPIQRPKPFAGQNEETPHPNTLLLCGAHSPYVNETVDLYSKLDPKVSTWIKVDDATGLLLDEKPTVVANALILFLQGQGHVPNLKPPTVVFAEGEELNVSHTIS